MMRNRRAVEGLDVVQMQVNCEKELFKGGKWLKFKIIQHVNYNLTIFVAEKAEWCVCLFENTRANMLEVSANPFFLG